MATGLTETSGAPPHQTRPPSQSSFTRPATSTTATPPWAGGSLGAGNPHIKRSYSEIIADAKSSKSSVLIQFKLFKVVAEDVKPPNLQNSDFGEFLFDFLKIDAECCLGVDMATGRYDTKELLVKAGTDLTNILTSPSSPHLFKQHTISATVLSSQVTKVTFRNVPLYVPDEEILHLCCHYGELPEGVVHNEKVNLGNAANHSLPSSTRWVMVRLHPGKTLRNYYWMAGPLPGDVGRRITVLHSNQPRQCSHCFKYPPSAASSPITKAHCPGGGDGKTCKSRKTPREKMSKYIELLRTEGYVSLRDQHFSTHTAFPSLQLNGKKQDEVLAAIDAADHDLDQQVGEEVGKEEQPPPSSALLPIVSISSSESKSLKSDTQKRRKREKPLRIYVAHGNNPVSDQDMMKFAVDSLVDGDIILNEVGQAIVSPTQGDVFLKECRDSAGKTQQSKDRLNEVTDKVWALLKDPIIHAKFKQKLDNSPEGKKKGGRTFSESVEEEIDTGLAKSQRVVSPVKI